MREHERIIYNKAEKKAAARVGVPYKLTGRGVSEELSSDIAAVVSVLPRSSGASGGLLPLFVAAAHGAYGES